MWRLNTLVDKAKLYPNLQRINKETLFESIIQKVKKIENSEIKSFLSDDKIIELLISKPKELYEQKDKLTGIFFDNGKLKILWSEKNKNKTVKDLFNYKSFISSNKNISFQIAKLIGTNTCVYCNRQYTLTVDKKNPVCRPDFDHYLSQNECPFFALSLYNLIPSCTICNSRVKGKNKLNPNMNPYLNSMYNNFFKFSYVPDGKGQPVEVKIQDINPDTKNEITETDINDFLECFKIKEVYDAHTEYELRDLYTFATKYSDAYLQNLMIQIGKDFKISKEETYRLLFGTELFENKCNNRPLSKFKRDILEELGVIKHSGDKNDKF